MQIRAAAIALGVFFLVPSWAYSLEIIAPSQRSVLTEGKVTVVGLAPKAEKGKAEFAGHSTSFRVKDGVFSVPLSLKPGDQTVTLVVGSETLKLDLKIDPAAKSGTYKYHPGVEGDKCGTCHGETRLTRDDQVSELCQHCHKDKDKGQYVHGPTAMGLCAACHDPHGSKEGKGLRMKVVDLCQDCHNQPVSEKHRKNAGDEPCNECHTPHAGSKQYMLR